MVERTLVGIIVVVFLLSSWWWSHRQQAAEDFYEAQLRDRDRVIAQLRMLALPQVKGKNPEQVQQLLQGLYPAHEVRHDQDMISFGTLEIRFDEGSATGLYLPWDDLQGLDP